jgi:hypothetical protein
MPMVRDSLKRVDRDADAQFVSRLPSPVSRLYSSSR